MLFQGLLAGKVLAAVMVLADELGTFAAVESLLADFEGMGIFGRIGIRVWVGSLPCLIG
jgi:hypothetical protein